MKVTKREINYKSLGFSCIIPKGTSVIPATNLPDEGKYWVNPWPTVNEEAESWLRNYGVLVDESEVEERSFLSDSHDDDEYIMAQEEDYMQWFPDDYFEEGA